jgi:hypothetical protein
MPMSTTKRIDRSKLTGWGFRADISCNRAMRVHNDPIRCWSRWMEIRQKIKRNLHTASIDSMMKMGNPKKNLDPSYTPRAVHGFCAFETVLGIQTKI